MYRAQTLEARKPVMHTPYLRMTQPSVLADIRGCIAEKSDVNVSAITFYSAMNNSFHTLWQVHNANTDPRNEVRHPIIPDRVLG